LTKNSHELFQCFHALIEFCFRFSDVLVIPFLKDRPRELGVGIEYLREVSHEQDRLNINM